MIWPIELFVVLILILSLAKHKSFNWPRIIRCRQCDGKCVMFGKLFS